MSSHGERDGCVWTLQPELGRRELCDEADTRRELRVLINRRHSALDSLKLNTNVTASMM